MNETLAYTGLKIGTNTEYTPDGLETVLSGYAFFCHVDEKEFVSGRGHRKSREQRYYEKLKEYTDKLREYVVRIRICGPDCNSYSQTDHDATFMRMKKDYMGNGQLLPADGEISRTVWFLSQISDCGCPYAGKCKKTDGNRTVRINEELSSMHKEVLDNFESIQGAVESGAFQLRFFSQPHFSIFCLRSFLHVYFSDHTAWIPNCQ